jgi:hypothetical protein
VESIDFDGSFGDGYIECSGESEANDGGSIYDTGNERPVEISYALEAAREISWY